MGIDVIYGELEKKSFHIANYFGRKLITIKQSDFEPYKKYFVVTKNLLNSKVNYRTRNKLKHIHAIQIDEFVQIHFDYGNPCENPVMAVPHLFVDVMPYFAWHLLTLKKPYQIEAKEN